MKKKTVIICLLFIIPQFILAQELDATVTINVEQLDTSSRGRLDNFKTQMQDYLNNTKFTKQPWQGEKIKCSFTVFFVGSPDETTYSAQMVVTSLRPIYATRLSSLMLNIMDSNWQFVYQRNQSMYFNQKDFDPLTSFLDFYAYIIIGFDGDSFDKMGGTDCFQKALEICVKGGSSAFSKGWLTESTVYNRRVLVDNLLNTKYQQFRADYFDYHYNGIDLLHVENQTQNGYYNMIKLVKDIERARDDLDPRSVLLKVFFDAKAGEFAENFKGYPDKSVLTLLKKIDPPHTSKYDEALK